jgi:hypothetical protein
MFLESALEPLQIYCIDFMTFESHDTFRTTKSIINRLFHAIRHRRKQCIYRQLPQPTEILIESFLAIWMFSITGCLEA